MKELFDEFGHGTAKPRLPLHRNPGLEIVYLRRGRVKWECDGKLEAVPPDSVYFTLPWQRHGSVAEFEPGHELFFVVIRLKTEHFDRPGPFDFLDMVRMDAATSKTIRRLLTSTARHAWPATPLARTLLPELVAELEAPSMVHTSRVLYLTGLLIVELAAIVGRSGLSPQDRYAPKLTALLGELEANCADPWTLAQMAEHVGVKRTRFEALFHNYTGDTPTMHLQRLRVEKACGMLHDTKQDITTIAMECGFASSQHLANLFRRFTSVTPSHYRRFGAPEVVLPRKQKWE